LQTIITGLLTTYIFTDENFVLDFTISELWFCFVLVCGGWMLPQSEAEIAEKKYKGKFNSLC
jgi:hypothetical protein